MGEIKLLWETYAVSKHSLGIYRWYGSMELSSVWPLVIATNAFTDFVVYQHIIREGLALLVC